MTVLFCCVLFCKRSVLFCSVLVLMLFLLFVSSLTLRFCLSRVFLPVCIALPYTAPSGEYTFIFLFCSVCFCPHSVLFCSVILFCLVVFCSMSVQLCSLCLSIFSSLLLVVHYSGLCTFSLWSIPSCPVLFFSSIVFSSVKFFFSVFSVPTPRKTNLVSA